MMKIGYVFALMLPLVFAKPNTALAESVPLESIPLTLKFEAAVNGKAFDCSQSYTEVGRSASRIQVQDFRLYLSRLRLINVHGDPVPLTLDQNLFQYENLALLDFENRTGHCTGTPATHTVITGTVPAGDYRGLVFDLGVPFTLNHNNVINAPSPLNMSSLFWVWRSGYKFARMDFKSTGMPQGYFIHLGSTGCEGSQRAGVGSSLEKATEAPLQCRAPNRPSIFLPDFNPEHDVIRVDLGTLLKDSNVDTNQPQSAAGCMSGVDDGDCLPLFRNLGIESLALGSPQSSSQSLFHIQHLVSEANP